MQQANQADLLIYVVDSSEELDENDRDIIQLIQGRKAIVLYNKIDLDPKIRVEELASLTGQEVIPVSAKDGQGIQALEHRIEHMFDIQGIQQNDQVVITNVRHKTALMEAEQSLQMVQQSIEDGMPEDFYTIDLMNAYEVLGSIIGEAVGDDLVNEIFHKFCMGK